jgi:hypothetical protein
MTTLHRLVKTSAVALSVFSADAAEPKARPHLAVRGIYGGVPTALLEKGATLSDSAVNAIWMGSGSVTKESVDLLHAQGSKVFAEFNTLHDAGFLKEHPDAAPVGPDGIVSPAPDGWQGVCPTHPGYRKNRMEAFRRVLATYEIDGIWLDYHHSHASWEQAVPKMPDTCFCSNCLAKFQADTGIKLPARPVAELSQQLLGEDRPRWVQWRCDLLTDWVREFRAIVNATRPQALLGTFHCPWSDTDNGGALREKLAIDLKAQARYLDVFSPMPYHARFGHVQDPAWISRQTQWLGQHLGIEGRPGERLRIWPIVQLADWGEPVPPRQVAEVLDHGTRLPATGVMIFAWHRLQKQPESVQEMVKYYRAVRP